MDYGLQLGRRFLALKAWMVLRAFGVEGIVARIREHRRLNERLMAVVNASGEAYLTHTRLRGRLWLRLAVGNVLTTERHLARTWDLLRDATSTAVAKAAQSPSACGRAPEWSTLPA